MTSKGWAIKTIGTLIQEGVILVHKDGNHGSNYPRASEFGTEGVPFLTAKLLDDSGNIDFSSAPRLSNEKADKFTFGFIETGDVLLSHNATIGRVAVVPKISERVLIGTSLTQFRLDPERLLPKYLAAYFAGRDFQNQLAAVMSQTTRNQVPITSQRKLSIVVPPIWEQVGIADALGAFDDKIELNRRMNETLEAMARALFKSWFVDFDPARAKASGEPPESICRRLGLTPDLLALFPDRLVDSELGEIPEGWEVQTIYSVANVIYGAPFASSKFNAKGIGVPLLRIRDLKTEMPGVWTDEVHPKGYMVRAGDIVVGMDGEFRAYIWGGQDAWLNQRVCVFKPNDGYSAAFVHGSIAPLLAHVEETETATTVIHLGKNDIDRFKVVVPRGSVLAEFNSLVTPFFERLVSNKKEIRTLASLREALLPRLLSGELSI